VSGGVLNAAMLLGLLAAAVPVIVHLLNRRRDEVVDWGAMQFLELGQRARRKIQLTELLLMLARMGLLAIVALALARPYWTRSAATATTGGLGLGETGTTRDVVLVIDGSESMDRKYEGTTARAEAVRWARRFVSQLRPGDSVAVLVAGDRVRPLVDPPSFDKRKIDAVLAGWKRSRGSSDLPAALGEAFRILERTQNPGRDVILLTDGQRFAWRPGEPKRWDLLRALHKRLPVAPRVWSIGFGMGKPSDAPNGAVGPLQVSRALVTPGLPVVVTTALSNAGPGPLTRTAELLIDGHLAPGTAQVVGPIPAGGQAPLSFRVALAAPGSHLLTVRLVGGDDALPGDDAASVPIEVASALPVLLVDGEPGLEPLSGETDFLRAALAPTGDDTPQVRATVVAVDRFQPEMLQGQSVVVLANVARLGIEPALALERFVESGGGLWIAPGDQTDPEFLNNQAWIPARLGELKGDTGARKAIAHPAPSTFSGPVLTPFAEGDSPALAEADFFAYRVLTPAPGASVSARLDTGDPWAVERVQGRGRVLLLATPIDAEAGTLPVNPDFVPLVHEWVFQLAGGSARSRVIRPGEPLVFELDPPPAPGLKTLPVETPGGTTVQATIVRGSGSTQARLDDTSESGIYRLSPPKPADGPVYALVTGDGRELDTAPLEPAEAARLAEGWPLAIETDPARLTARLFESERGRRHEFWRLLVLAALGGLCLEIYLTRKLVRSQGIGVA
jgi:hypothetical protein